MGIWVNSLHLYLCCYQEKPDVDSGYGSNPGAVGWRWGEGTQESRLREGVKKVCGTIKTGPRPSAQPTGGWGSIELQVQEVAHSFKASALLLVCLVAKSYLLIKDSIHSSICTYTPLCICSVSQSTNIYWMWIARIFAKCQGENIAINHRLYT